MVEIGGIVVPVAYRALEHRIVVRIRVASGTHAGSVAVIGVEPGVGKRRSQPTGGVVAGGARAGGKPGAGNQAGGDVVGDQPAQACGALPCRSVATVAVKWWQSCSDVAQGAGNRGVRAG